MTRTPHKFPLAARFALTFLATLPFTLQHAAAQVTMPIPPPPPIYRHMTPGEGPASPDADSKPGDRFSDAEAENRLENYADCLVRNPILRRKVETFVRAIPGSQAYVDEGQALMTPGCLTVNMPSDSGIVMHVQNDTLREASFGALFRREFGKRAPTDFAALPPLSLSAAFDGSIDTLTPGFRGRRALGDCVARAAPVAVRDLLFTHPGSSEETDLLPQIIPAMQGCLTVDQKVDFNRYELRGILAEAIYQLEQARAQAPQAPNPGKQG